MLVYLYSIYFMETVHLFYKHHLLLFCCLFKVIISYYSDYTDYYESLWYWALTFSTSHEWCVHAIFSEIAQNLFNTS